MYFPGNTIVSQVPTNSPQHKLLVDICNFLKQSPIGRFYTFLPPSSLHVTITKGLTPGIKLANSETKTLNWKEAHELLEKKLADILSRFI